MEQRVINWMAALVVTCMEAGMNKIKTIIFLREHCPFAWKGLKECKEFVDAIGNEWMDREKARTGHWPALS